MGDHDVSAGSTTEGLPVAPAMGPALELMHVPTRPTLVDQRVVFIAALALGIGFTAALMAEGLLRLIGLITNVAFYGRFSSTFASPMNNRLGLWVLIVPVVGGLIVGLMARYGSKAIRGHGIPEAIEQVLRNRSRIPLRMMWLKPLSAAIAIGTGGPFGAEGPIIATGGALGSVVGQFIRTTAAERKTLLAAGAAAGMAATFGSPVAAVLLAVELLVFEFRPRSLVPIALASATAAGVRLAFHGSAPVFALASFPEPTGAALAAYILIGALVGLAATLVTRLVYAIEDGFERLPIHWMWWPALGAMAVGVVGYFAPRTLGVGYNNIEDLLANRLVLRAVAFLVVLKLVSWSIALGSGTSGGTLAPLFTIGAGIGAMLGAAGAWALPGAAIDPRVAALVGMAAMLAGAARAMLASVVFVFETTRQPMGLLPLLGGGAGAFLVSCLLMRNTIMTEKIVRRGIKVPEEYAADFLDQVPVREMMSPKVVALRAGDSLEQVRRWVDTGASGTAHQGFPVVDERGVVLGVVTRRDLLGPSKNGCRTVRDLIVRPPIVVYDDRSLRDAADHMVNHDVGRLPVIDHDHPGMLAGIITRSDVLRGYRKRLDETVHDKPATPWPWVRRRARSP